MGFRLGHAVGVPEAFKRSVELPMKENACTLTARAVTIHQTHDSVRITIFDPRFGSYHDFFVGGGRKKKKDF